MNQIKLVSPNSPVSDQPSPKYKYKEVYTVGKKQKNNAEQNQNLEPWMENAQTNPFLHVKLQQRKKYTTDIKRYSSQSIFKSWKSSKNIRIRQSKKIPVMDIGELNSIRKTVYPIRIKDVMSSHPTTKDEHRVIVNRDRVFSSVKQQLNIERKLFIMNNPKWNIFDSQMRKSKMRNLLKITNP